MPCKTKKELTKERILRVGGATLALLVFVSAMFVAVLSPAFVSTDVANAAVIYQDDTDTEFTIFANDFNDSVTPPFLVFTLSDVSTWILDYVQTYNSSKLTNVVLYTFFRYSDDIRVADIIFSYEADKSLELYLRMYSDTSQSSYSRYGICTYSLSGDSMSCRTYCNTFAFGFSNAYRVYGKIPEGAFLFANDFTEYLSFADEAMLGKTQAYIDLQEDFRHLQDSYDGLSDEHDSLQYRYDELQAKYDSLKKDYDNTYESLAFDTVGVVNTSTTYPVKNYHIDSVVTSLTYADNTYNGYFYRSHYSDGMTSDRPFLCALKLNYSIAAGYDYCISYDYLGMFDNDSIVTSTIGGDVFVAVSFSTYSIDDPNYLSGYVRTEYIAASNSVDGFMSFNLDSYDSSVINFVSFDLVSYHDGVYYKVPLRSSEVDNLYEGLFMSNFLVGVRGASLELVKQDSFNTGYNSGYSEGLLAGKNIGYQQGAGDQGDYTFFGLIASVFDAPISAFKGLFNFEILGVDMSAFVSSLFALSVIIVIVKIALGGK